MRNSSSDVMTDGYDEILINTTFTAASHCTRGVINIYSICDALI